MTTRQRAGAWDPRFAGHAYRRSRRASGSCGPKLGRSRCTSDRRRWARSGLDLGPAALDSRPAVAPDV